ncbi:MAG: YccF domain-containing protein [Candidatus Krumholzibacteriia bacterium]
MTHVVLGLLCAVTIVGIPFAKQHMKLASLALTPFGHTYE